MRTWKSACVVLALSVLSITLVAIGMKGSVHPAHANTRTASSTEVTLTSTLTVAAPSVKATNAGTKYVVQDGDTLSGIAARFAVHGGWPAVYAANRHAIGRDPNTIRPGTVLALPSLRLPARYTVGTGDTLSGIAAELGLHGGWPVLYAANRRAVGRDPNALRPGTVLTIPRPVTPLPSKPGAAHRRHRPPSPSVPAPAPAPTGARHHPRPVTREAGASTGMPRWLKIVLLAVGLLILVALLIEPVLAVRRRRRRRQPQQLALEAPPPGPADSGRELPRPPVADKAIIVLADYDRLVVTCNQSDDTVYVLRPPGEDPRAILRVARLVVPEGPYGELAKQLGMPAIGPVD